MSAAPGRRYADRRGSASVLRRPRLWAAVLALSIPVWWLTLRWWAEETVGYLEVDGMGVSAFAWIGLIAVAAAVLTVNPVRALRVIVLGLITLVAIGLAFHNLLVGLADGGISQPGWMVAALSALQLTVIVGGAVLSAER